MDGLTKTIFIALNLGASMQLINIPSGKHVREMYTPFICES